MSFAKSAFAALAITISLGFASAASSATMQTDDGWYGVNDEGKNVLVTTIMPDKANKGDPGAVKLCKFTKVIRSVFETPCGYYTVRPILLEKAKITPDVPFADPSTVASASATRTAASGTICQPEPNNRNLYDCPVGISPADPQRYQLVSGNTYRDTYASQNGSPFQPLPNNGYDYYMQPQPGFVRVYVGNPFYQHGYYYQPGYYYGPPPCYYGCRAPTKAETYAVAGGLAALAIAVVASHH